MRIRVQTLPPLPDLKAWFVPGPSGAILTVKTISELKKVLCNDIRQLSQGGQNFKTIRLLLEGFELLDELPYEEVLRDGDLIFIHASKGTPVKSEDVKKRKRQETLDVPTKKRKKSVFTKNMDHDSPMKASTSSDSSNAVESSSFSTTSESDNDSESSDSDSSSTSSSEASSESSDGAIDSLSASSSHPLSLLPEPIPQSKTTAISHVPPGHGKSSTHSRNRRRRLKRQHERESKETQDAPPPRGTSDANLTPLGSAASAKPLKGTKSGTTAESETKTTTELSKTQSASSESQKASSPPALDNSNGDIMMMSLRNKNKKKNFRQTMVAPAVRKIVFDDNGNGQSVDAVAPVPDTASSDSSSLHAESVETVQADIMADSSTSLPSRVLPPSELAAAGLLPSNMFVTSVEFGRPPKKKTKKKNLKDTHEEKQLSHELRASWTYEDEDESRFEDANISLPYGNEEESRNNTDLGQSQFDWEKAESNWDRFARIESADQLHPGALVGVQSLTINPRTFTPERMLCIGRVKELSTKTVTILRLCRPGSEVAAAFGIGQENEGEGEEDEASLEDLIKFDWRVVELD